MPFYIFVFFLYQWNIGILPNGCIQIDNNEDWLFETKNRKANGTEHFQANQNYSLSFHHKGLTQKQYCKTKLTKNLSR